MSVVGDCKKCSLPVDTAVHDFIVCEGKCSKPYHLECVRLTVEVLSVLSSNILWICDDCLADFHRYRERKPDDKAAHTHPNKSIEDEVEGLKIAVADIASAVAVMNQRKGPNIPHCSTPATPMNLLDGTLPDGTDVNPENSKANESSQTSSPSSRIGECTSFALYLTNIDNCCSEYDISRTVSHCLCAPISNCMQVTKLVPKRTNCNTLGYISFRVELDVKWKLLALSLCPHLRGPKG